MKIHLIIILGLIAKSIFSASYHEKTDSLLRNLESSTSNFNSKNLLDISRHLEHTNIDSALLFARKSLSLSIKSNDTNSLLLSKIYVGRLLHLNRQSKLGRLEIFECLQILETYDSYSIKAYAWDNLGLNYRNNFIFDSAELYYKKAFNVSRTIEDTFRQINIINNLALIKRDIAAHYRDRNNISFADNLCNQAIDKLDESLSYFDTYNNTSLRAEVYYLKYGIYEQMNNYSKALENLLKFEKYQLIEYGYIEPLLNIRIAKLLINLGENLESEPRINIALYQLKNIKLSNKLIDIYSELQKYYFDYGDYEKSLFYLNKKIQSQNQVKQISGINKNEKIDGKEFYGNKTLSLNLEIIDKKNELKILNEINKKRIHQRNTIIYGIAFFTLVIAILLIYVWRQSKILNELNMRLVEATNLKHKIFGIISHDLKNLLFTLIMVWNF